jgi:hypothetical protein
LNRTTHFIIVRRKKKEASSQKTGLRVSNGKQNQRKGAKKKKSTFRRITQAAVISIFFPLTLFHSKNTAPTTLSTEVATAT